MIVFDREPPLSPDLIRKLHTGTAAGAALHYQGGYIAHVEGHAETRVWVHAADGDVMLRSFCGSLLLLHEAGLLKPEVCAAVLQTLGQTGPSGEAAKIVFTFCPGVVPHSAAPAERLGRRERLTVASDDFAKAMRRAATALDELAKACEATGLG